MISVLVTDHPAPTTEIEAEIIERIGGRLVVATSGDEAELLRLVADADAILTCFGRVSPAVIKAGTRLRVIGRYGVGVDNIAVDIASERRIPVTNVPIYCIDEVAEHTIALLLTLARGTAAYDASVRAGLWDIKAAMPLHRVAGSTLGVVGLGHIGRAVALRGQALGLRVIGVDPHTTAAQARELHIELCGLVDLLQRSDFVTLHLPLVDATRHLIDGTLLALMKPTAFLINCARGAIVDIEALAAALTDGRLAGAGLDVFDPERLPVDHALVALRNTVLTPHVAFYSEESIAELQTRAAQNVVDVLSRGSSANIVNADNIMSTG
jgi:D-3-phosphoglycerate dehydrogenase